MGRKLAAGGGFARTVYTDEQNDSGLATQIQLGFGAQALGADALENGVCGGLIGGIFIPHGVAQLIQYRHGNIHARVAQHKGLLHALEILFAELIGAHGIEDIVAGLGKTAFQFFKKGHGSYLTPVCCFSRLQLPALLPPRPDAAPWKRRPPAW